MLKSLCGVLLAFVLALAVAQEAGAKPRSIVIPGGQGVEFGLRASNGYRLDVSKAGPRVSVTVSRKRQEGIATYTVRGRRHGERGFEAKLPEIGRIAVEFVPRGKVTKIPVLEGCSGRPGRTEAGTFVGTINFHGERGYTDLTATRARGVVRQLHRQTCEFSNGGGKGKGFESTLTGDQLVASTRTGGLFFVASRLKLRGQEAPPPILSYAAFKISGGNGMQILRAAFGDGPDESFAAQHNGRSASARVEPGAPFTGTADFAAESDGSVNWTGDLSVAFPGTEAIGLTGERFETQLCVRRRCAGDLNTGTSIWSIGFAKLRRLAAASSAAPTPRLWPR